MKTLFIDIWKRLTPWNKSAEIYSNDTDNAYPERMDRLISNSVTAKSAADIMMQYLLGKGYGSELDNFIVNKDKGLKLIDFADDVSNDLVKQRGVFIHVNWNALYQISDMRVIPFAWCRVGSMDSNDYAGKIAISKEWSERKQKKIQLVDVYNPLKKVIDAQVEKAGGWENYKGQILFINMDSSLIYPLSRIDAVAEDCDSEAQAATYKNRLLRKGFFGTTIVTTRPLIGEGVDEYIDGKLNPEYLRQDSERKIFQDAIKKTLGAENVGGVLCLEMDFAGEDISKAIDVKQIDSKINDQLFSYTENSIRENILIAFNNLPSGLVKTSDNSLFGNSGGAIKEMKLTYWENTTKERNLLTNTLNGLLARMETPKIINPIELLENGTTDNQGGNTEV